MPQRFDPSSLHRIVIKVGSSSIVRSDGVVRLGFLGKLVTTVCQMNQRGARIVIVSSGAIALGTKQFGLDKRPGRIQDKQACAATGQTELMTLYQKLFSTLSMQTAQVLLTREDLNDRRRYLNAKETLLRLLDWGAVPIVNENDSVSVEEIQFGDNDELSALVAGLIDADMLVLLTDVDGLYDGNPKSDPNAKIIETVDRPIEELLDLTNFPNSSLGRGGMRSKLKAAGMCRNFGIPCMVVRSKGSVLEQALNGESVGTYVVPMAHKVDSRSRWLAKAATVQGTVFLDDGAKQAVAVGGKSLLPRGIAKVEGNFSRGAVVVLADLSGNDIGRGIIHYGSADLVRIIGKYGDEIESVLGFTFGDEVVHCDDIALTQ